MCGHLLYSYHISLRHSSAWTHYRVIILVGANRPYFTSRPKHRRMKFTRSLSRAKFRHTCSTSIACVPKLFECCPSSTHAHWPPLAGTSALEQGYHPDDLVQTYPLSSAPGTFYDQAFESCLATFSQVNECLSEPGAAPVT